MRCIVNGMIYIYLHTLMALIGCEQCGHTGPSPKRSKSGPPTQEIALFLRSNSRTSTCQK